MFAPSIFEKANLTGWRSTIEQLAALALDTIGGRDTA
jgi:hypothetical protein